MFVFLDEFLWFDVDRESKPEGRNESGVSELGRLLARRKPERLLLESSD
jgi:hypothetical protein